MASMSDVTRILSKIEQGDSQAAEQLLSLEADRHDIEERSQLSTVGASDVLWPKGQRRLDGMSRCLDGG